MDRRGLRSYNNWFCCFTRQSLLDEAAPAGFAPEGFYSDMAGTPYAEDSTTICAVLRQEKMYEMENAMQITDCTETHAPAECVSYVPIDEAIERKIFAWSDDASAKITKHDMLPKREGCYCIAAMCGGQVAGFAAFAPARWTPPLEQYGDAFIHSIEVAEPFRRRGIGRQLITLLEERARACGHRQIRAWSSYDKPEALHMWYAMGYAMCPVSEPIYKHGKIKGLIPGYYYAKILNPAPTGQTNETGGV